MDEAQLPSSIVRRQSFISRGLIAAIAGFAALGLAVIAIIYWAVLAVPQLSFTSIDATLRILIIAAVVAFTIYVLASPESVGRGVGTRSTRLTANAVVASLIAVALGIVVNTIFETVPTARADLTANQTFTLSEQTKSVLAELERRNLNVSALAFIAGGTPQLRQEAEDLLKAYQAETGRLSFEFIDPEQAPARAVQFGVTRFNVVVFTDGNEREVADGTTERDFTSAMIRLLQTEPKRVAFLIGHGERDSSSFEQPGYAQARQSLDQNNFQTLNWNLITSPTITLTDATVLVIAHPQQPLAPSEAQAVQTYLDQNGRVLLLLDPAMSDEALQSVRPIMDKYGVTATKGFVVDLERTLSAQDPSVVGVNDYPVTDITEVLDQQGLTTVFPGSLAVSPPTSTIGGFQVLPILRSSVSSPGFAASWLETKPPVAEFDPNEDLPGPVNMALQVQHESAVLFTSPTTDTNVIFTKLVIFGDADFASNGVLQDPRFYNLDLFANAVSWLAGANELVSIRPKESTSRTITLDAGQRNLVFTTAVLGLPLLVLLAGAFSWWRRR